MCPLLGPAIDVPFDLDISGVRVTKGDFVNWSMDPGHSASHTGIVPRRLAT